MNILDHLSPQDKDLFLDKLARYTAQEVARQQLSTVVYNGQQAIATALGCSRNTAGKLLAEQKINYTRLGRKGYAVTHLDIQNYLQKT